MSDFKFACPQCQQHLQAGPDYAGLEIACPTCGGRIIVPRPAPASPITSLPPPLPAPPPPPSPAVRVNKPALAIARPQTAVLDAPPLPPLAPAPSRPASTPRPAGTRPAGQTFCRSHRQALARFHCEHCNTYLCDLCVTARSDHNHTVRSCRKCGNEVAVVETQPLPGKRQPGFFALLPGAFIYPFRGTGILVLIVSALLFTALNFLAGGFLGLIFTAVVLGYLFLYSQNIIFATAAEEDELPELPGFDGIFGAFFQLLGCVFISFGLPLGLLITRFVSEVEVPWPAIIATGVLGCLYFPMCFLAVAMKDTIAAANPLFVLPSILKVPLEYLVATILFIGVFAVRFAGEVTSAVASEVSTSTRDMKVMFISFGIRIAWLFVSIYLLTISMRVLGLLYVSKKRVLGWFPR